MTEAETEEELAQEECEELMADSAEQLCSCLSGNVGAVCLELYLIVCPLTKNKHNRTFSHAFGFSRMWKFRVLVHQGTRPKISLLNFVVQ